MSVKTVGRHDGCAYPVVECDKPEWRCLPAEQCPSDESRVVHRDKYSSGGHHHFRTEYPTSALTVLPQ